MVSRCREEERKKGIKEEKHGYHCTFPARTIQFFHKRKREGRMLKTIQGVYYLHSMQFRSGISHRHRSANARMYKTVGDSRTRTRLGYREYPRQLRTRARTRGKNRDGGKVGYIKKKREREKECEPHATGRAWSGDQWLARSHFAQYPAHAHHSTAIRIEYATRRFPPQLIPLTHARTTSGCDELRPEKSPTPHHIPSEGENGSVYVLGWIAVRKPYDNSIRDTGILRKTRMCARSIASVVNLTGTDDHTAMHKKEDGADVRGMEGGRAGGEASASRLHIARRWRQIRVESSLSDSSILRRRISTSRSNSATLFSASFRFQRVRARSSRSRVLKIRAIASAPIKRLTSRWLILSDTSSAAFLETNRVNFLSPPPGGARVAPFSKAIFPSWQKLHSFWRKNL